MMPRSIRMGPAERFPSTVLARNQGRGPRGAAVGAESESESGGRRAQAAALQHATRHDELEG